MNMKIGQVVRQYGIPVNSLYFYINDGLLVPPKRNKQYVFDERTIEDLEWILELKEMKFPLKTIHRLLSLRRISNFCSLEDREERERIFRQQDESLMREEMQVSHARRSICVCLDRHWLHGHRLRYGAGCAGLSHRRTHPQGRIWRSAGFGTWRPRR